MRFPPISLILILLFVFVLSCKEQTQTAESSSSKPEQQTQPDTLVKAIVDTFEVKPIEKVIDSLNAESRPTTFKKAEVIESSKKTPKPMQQLKRTRNRLTAQMTFESETHNFGEIEQGESFIHKFKFMNTGSAPLVINKVDATCGCTQPTYPFLPIEPGDTGAVEVKYNSVGKLGRQKPLITISSNANPAIIKLYLEGLVSAPLEKDSLSQEN